MACEPLRATQHGGLVLALVLACLARDAVASPGVFSRRSEFQTAVGGGVAIVDFEALPAGADVSGTVQLPSGAVAVALTHWPGVVAAATESWKLALPVESVITAAEPR